MCGIIGYIGPRHAAPIVLEGLARLEYRGYDSVGIALQTPDGLSVHKHAGRIDGLLAGLPGVLPGRVGVRHTRWATHGAATERNAHPHLDASRNIAVVHNGIIENAGELREMLLDGVEFASETDTEVLAHLIAAQNIDSLEGAVRAALLLVEGTYGIAVLDQRHPDRIVVARNGSPVLIGVGRGEHFVASDVAAVVRYTDQIVHLEDREIAVLEADSFRTFTLDLEATSRAPSTSAISLTSYDKAGHRDFMHKEIAEQPVAIERALRGRLDHRMAAAHLGGIDLPAREALAIQRIKIVGCGSAYYAAMAGAQLLEQVTRIPSDAEAASEFRYRHPVIDAGTLYIAVSQSGETFDTIAAVREILRKGGRVLGVVNVPGSTLSRECGALCVNLQ